MIYVSVALGPLLLAEIYGQVPGFVFYSVMAGWVAYLICALAVAKGQSRAYVFVVALAILTLAVSLPQPAHYSLVTNQEFLAASTFLLGSAFQILLIILIPIFLLRRRKS